MKILISISIVSLLLGISGCRKQKKEPSAQVNSVIGNPENINGEFTTVHHSFLNNNSLLYTHFQARAAFFQNISPSNYVIYPSTINIGNISLNNVQFGVSPGDNPIYFDTTGIEFQEPYYWKLRSNDFKSNFDFSDSPIYPTYSGATGLPDTLIIGAQNIIHIGSCNADYATITIQGIGGGNMITKTIHYPFQDLIISADELLQAGYVHEATGILYMSFSNVNYRYAKDKVYKFTATTSFSNPFELVYQ